MITELTISWAAPQVGNLLTSGTQLDEPDVVARLGNRLCQASEILKAWLLANGGQTIYDVVTQGAFRAPVDSVHDLGRIIEQLKGYVETPYHFGIGVGIKESADALRQAFRAGEPWQFYDEASGSREKSADDPTKLGAELQDNPLEKAVNDGDDHWAPAETSENPEQSQGGAQNPSGVASPEPQDTSQAQGGPAAGPEDQQDQDGPEDERAEAKKMVAKALLAIKAQAAALHQLKEIKPEAFEAVKNIIQAMVVIAHQLQDTPESVQKAESLWKRLKLPEPKLSKKPAAPKYPDALPSPASVGGTIKDGAIKVAPVDPESGAPRPQGWNQARSGAITGPHGSAVSSKNPGTE